MKRTDADVPLSTSPSLPAQPVPVRDPVARPHYPPRPLSGRARVVTTTLVDENSTIEQDGYKASGSDASKR